MGEDSVTFTTQMLINSKEAWVYLTQTRLWHLKKMTSLLWCQATTEFRTLVTRHPYSGERALCSSLDWRHSGEQDVLTSQALGQGRSRMRNIFSLQTFTQPSSLAIWQEESKGNTIQLRAASPGQGITVILHSSPIYLAPSSVNLGAGEDGAPSRAGGGC